MTFSTLMVHLELEHPNDARLQIAGDLAEKFSAKVIGIPAANPQPPNYVGGDRRVQCARSARSGSTVDEDGHYCFAVPL